MQVYITLLYESNLHKIIYQILLVKHMKNVLQTIFDHLATVSQMKIKNRHTTIEWT